MWQRLRKLIANLVEQTVSTRPAATSSTGEPAWISRWERELAKRRAEREERRRQRRARDRVTFGEETWGVTERQRTAGLDEAKLARWDLPVLRDEGELAEWLGVARTRLRWFTYDKPADTTSHYTYYHVPKRSGGQRLIMAPKRELKALQRKVLHDLLRKIPASESAHGFVRHRSIATNAQPHVGQAAVLNLDLENFFPSVTYPRVRGFFIGLGYPFSVASALALLCTEHERESFEHDGKTYHISVAPRALPQGAPTSPALANLVAWRLDRRLAGLARKHGWTYSRYADDLSFSGSPVELAPRILHAAQHIIRDEHFVVNERKTRLARRSSRQIVTGLVVNDDVSTPREARRRMRAILHNARRTSLEAQNRDGHHDFRAYLHGMIGHVAAANPDQAARLRAALSRIEQD